MQDKFAIAAALQDIGTLLELKGGDNRFKARAYQRGARTVAGLSVDVGELIEQDRLTSIAGIGNALASAEDELPGIRGQEEWLTRLAPAAILAGEPLPPRPSRGNSPR